jgi:hypothetical protein
LLADSQTEAKKAIDTGATIIETKDPDDWTFLDKISRYYYDGLWTVNTFLINKSNNLLHKKNLLNNNQNLLYNHPIMYSDEEAQRIREELKQNADLIGVFSEKFENQLMDLKEIYEKQHFLEAKTGLRALRTETRKTGLVQWLTPNYFLQRKSEFNLDLLKQFNHYGTQVSDSIVPKDLIRNAYTLKNLHLKYQNETAKDRLHPALLEELEQVKDIYWAAALERKLTIPKINIGKTLGYWIPNKVDARGIAGENRKFQKLLHQGENWKDLPKAWEILKLAKQSMEDQPLVIYRDNKKRYTQLSGEVKLLIEELTQETENTKKETLFLMENFDFPLAKDQIELFLERLKSHQMVELIQDIEKHLQSSATNAELYGESILVEQVFESHDFLAASKAIEALQKKISQESQTYIVETLGQKIDALEEKITHSRDEGENIFVTELVALKTELMEKLNFDEALIVLNEKREIAEQQEYKNYLSQIAAFMKEFQQNHDVFTQYTKLTAMIEQEQFGDALQAFNVIYKPIKSAKILIYSHLEQEVSTLKENLQAKITEEKVAIENQIREIDGLVEDVDFEEAKEILSAAITRIHGTSLLDFITLLNTSTEKISLNQETQTEVQELQKIFSEGDLKIVDKRCRSLIEKINKANSKTPGLYSSTLFASIEMLHQQIQVALKDGVGKLTADFQQIPAQIQQTLDFATIQDLLTNYKIRAQRLGLEDLKAQIEEQLIICVKNANLVSELHLLETKYDRMEDFVQTLKDVVVLVQTTENEKATFDHVKNAIETFQEKVNRESQDREAKMQQSLHQIVEEELNTLHFTDASISLKTLGITAKNFGVSSIQAEIQGYLGICASHSGLLENVEEARIVAGTGKVIEARELINRLVSVLAQFKGVIIDPMRHRVDEVRNEIQTNIESQIAHLKGEINRIVGAIENQQAKLVYSELQDLIDTANYLEAGGMAQEIVDLLKLCELQFDPTELKKQKKKQKKSKSEEKVAKPTVRTQFVSTKDMVAEQVAISQQSTVFTVQKSALDDEDEFIPTFATRKEFREFRRKQFIRKTAQKVQPPVVETNLTNTLRSSATRKRLQRYNRQINVEQKRANISKCGQCGANQNREFNKFCDFCGKTLV